MTGTLNIIGGGRLGRTLARLWSDSRVLEVQSVMSRKLENAQTAISFIGAGRAIHSVAEFPPADLWLIATGDDQIAAHCDLLAGAGKLTADSIVFHCSGALSSTELASAARCGAAVASVHPLASFAEPDKMLTRFAGTFCGIEGDARALEFLGSAFTAIGGRVVAVTTESKIVYHAGAVFASNYLVAALESSLQVFEHAGIPRETALAMIEPLAKGVLDNVFNVGTARALTGPVARGDTALVKKQYAALLARSAPLGELYRQLALAAARLAGREIDL